MGIMNFLGKCEYSYAFAIVSIRVYTLSVFALSSNNQGDSLIFGVVVLICLLGEGKIIWILKVRVTKSATCALNFGAGLIS